jgi:hypothetical protein
MDFQLSCGKVAQVDAADLAMLTAYRWRSVTKKKQETQRYVYAEAYINGRCVLMHRLLCGLKHGERLVVDHKDRDGLNNTRANLRVCTDQQNAWNTRPRGSKVGYTGVWGNHGKFSARAGGEYLGFFSSPHRAALAVNRRLQEVRGEFAVLNEIDWLALEHDLTREVDEARSNLAMLELDLESARLELERRATLSFTPLAQPQPGIRRGESAAQGASQSCRTTSLSDRRP